MELATRGQRLLGAFVDGLVTLIPYVLLKAFPDSSAILAPTLAVLAAIFSIQIWLLCRDGQTLGKKAAGTRIVRVDTEENGGFTTNVLMRAIVSSLPNIVPLYWFVDQLFVFREDRRCLHDLIAGTKVVRAETAPVSSAA
jgi:uncharacterized RDD family membrane protein YckC